MSEMPEDLRAIANHLSHRFHQKELSEDLATAVAKLLLEERRRCAAVVQTMPDMVEASPGIYRKASLSDAASAILKPVQSPRLPTRS
ncbi:MAG: hypothetical protein ACK4P4_09170 [Allorhizobium sp.]